MESEHCGAELVPPELLVPLLDVLEVAGPDCAILAAEVRRLRVERLGEFELGRPCVAARGPEPRLEPPVVHAPVRLLVEVRPVPGLHVREADRSEWLDWGSTRGEMDRAWSDRATPQGVTARRRCE